MGVTTNYGAASTYVKIANQTLTGTSTGITFSNIPQGYTDLVLVAQFANSTSADIFLQYNGSSSSYSVTHMYGNGSSAASLVYNNQTVGLILDGGGLGMGTGQVSMTINIQNYSSTVMNKTTLTRSSAAALATAAVVGTWRSTAPITSLYFYPSSGNFAIGSTFTIYGIKAAFVPKATGGDIIVQDGTYWYHAFRSTGSFVPKQSLTADVLVVAGGGGTYFSVSGGGGAGGVLAYSSQSLAANTGYTATVGAGGGANTNGSNSQFASLTASVGGGTHQANGGSGGGADGPGSTAAGTGTAGQGNNGGTRGSNYGGGGGGAGAAGGTGGTNSRGGDGGAGTNSVTNWGSLATALKETGLGVSGYIAGGGGGSAWNGVTSNNTGGNAGAGGGGAGGEGGGGSPQATNGTANTGGGAGGDNTSGKSGGSGLVIVRYAL